jgi:hypothetical protein
MLRVVVVSLSSIPSEIESASVAALDKCLLPKLSIADQQKGSQHN